MRIHCVACGRVMKHLLSRVRVHGSLRVVSQHHWYCQCRRAEHVYAPRFCNRRPVVPCGSGATGCSPNRRL